MHKKIIAAIAALAMSLVGFTASTQSANAADPNPATSGWFDQGNGSTDSYDRWSYPSYKVNCNNNPSQNSVAVILARRSGSTETIASQNVASVRSMFNRVASIYSASRRATVGPNGQVTKYADMSPKFVTFQAANGNCYPTLTQVAIPPSIYDQGSYDTRGATGLWTYLHDYAGFNASNRKYVVLVQGDDPTPERTNPTWSAVRGLSGIYDDDSNSRNNLNNYGGRPGSFATVWTNQSDYGVWESGLAEDVAHELGHNLGAVQPNSPNRNASNGWHAKYVGDIMGYRIDGTPGQVWDCPGDKAFNRMDTCTGLAGYFEQYNDNWTTSLGRWAVTSSSFLWGGKFTAPDAPWSGPSYRTTSGADGGVIVRD